MKLFSKKESNKPISPPVEEFPPLIQKEKRERLPPGQHISKRWPIYSAEKIPIFDGINWDITVGGLVENPKTWSWEEFTQLPTMEQVSDLHCVTTWSTYDHKFTGVAFKTILEIVKPLPEARYVTFEADSGYTSALPLTEGYLLENDVMLAYEHKGKPLTPDHGGPLRSLVPQLYLWKSVKWLKKMTFTKEWERGYWEQNFYHQRADPWQEERYSSQERPKRRDHKID